MMLIERIRGLAQQYADENIGIRRHLHAHPELSYQEFKTSAFVQQRLSDYGIPFKVMSTTGVVGIIEGKDPSSRVVALRADMDALPIQEENDIPYKSIHPGIMHACGHDVHTTCLLGAARILEETKEEWRGTVKLIFQPGEEKNPGGASIMIKDGVLDNPKPQGIFALHVHPGLDVGHVSFRSGTVMASADEIYITIRGQGGHAASPHLTTDTILLASQLVISLQQVISRNNDPFNPSVLSITSIQGGTATNIIPSEVRLMGTLRCMNETWRKRAHELIRRHVTDIADLFGADVSLHIDLGYPTVLNDQRLTRSAKEVAIGIMGEQQVSETEMRMGAEDFGYYAQLIPGCFFRLGVRSAGNTESRGVHTPVFDIDDDAIRIGVQMMAGLGALVEDV